MTRRIIQIYRGTTVQNDAYTGSAGELTMDTSRNELRVHDGSTAGGELIGVKPGFVMSFAGASVPTGWLLCDGSAVSRTTYAKLFAAIGTTYGVGDGSTTFNLPDLSQRVLMWRGNPGTKLDTGWLPNIRGSFSITNNNRFTNLNGSYCDGAFYLTTLTTSVHNWSSDGSGNGVHVMNFSAENANSVYSSSNTNSWVLPRSLSLYPCIKY